MGCLFAVDAEFGFLGAKLAFFIDVVVFVTECAELELWEDGIDIADKYFNLDKSCEF